MQTSIQLLDSYSLVEKQAIHPIDLVARAGLRSASHLLISELIQSSQSIVKLRLLACFRNNLHLDTPEVLGAMRAESYSPASLIDLLRLVDQKVLLPRCTTLVALGTVFFADSGCPFAACLNRDRGELDCCPMNVTWGIGTVFLGARDH